MRKTRTRTQTQTTVTAAFLLSLALGVAITLLFPVDSLGQTGTGGGGGTGGGSGSVTSFSAGNLSPLFTTSVATATTTPALSFSLSNATANTLLGNFTSGSAGPSFNAMPSCSSTNNALQYTSGTGFSCVTISGSAGGTVTTFSSGNLSPLFTTSVTNATSTPAQTFTLSNAGANTLLGNFTGSSSAPSYTAMPSCSASGDAIIYTSGTGFGCGTGFQTALTFTSPLVNTSGTVACATCVTSAASLTSGSIMTGAGSQASQTTALQITSSTIQDSVSTTAVTIEGGQSSSSTSALGGVLLRGANQTGTGGTNSAGGGIDLSGGNNAGTSGTSQAGSVELEAGESSAGGQQGLLVYGYQMNEGTGSTTQWDLECYTSANAMTVNDCAANPVDFVGVTDFHSGSSTEVHTPMSETPINASAAVTLYHTVCAGSTAGKVTDSGGTGPCPVGAGITVGKVIAVAGTWTLADGASFTASTTLPLVAITSRQTWGSGDLAATAVTPGSYTNANITVNAAGQVTAAANGSSLTVQTNSSNNSSQTTLNFETSTANSVGLTVTPSNPSGGIEKEEVTGTYSGGISSTQVTTGLGYTPANCTPGTSGSDCLTLSSGLVPSANLPTATSSVLGGVKPDGTTITNSSGAISVRAASTSVTGGVELTQDLGGTATAPEVLGLLDEALPSLSTGYLEWTGSAWAFGSPGGSGTVTSVTFTGDGTVLSSTPSAAVTSSGTVTATLANAGAGTILNNATTSAAAPTYTATPTLGKSGTLGSITMGNATSGTLTIEPVTGALGTVTVYIPDATDTLVNLAGTQTLTNKTLTSPTITTPSMTPQTINCSTACSPTAAQLSNALVSNYGQGSASVVITGPTPAAGMNFIMIVGTAPGGSYNWEYTSTTTNIYLDGSATAYTHVTFATPGVGNSLSCFSFQTGSSTYSLKCTTLAGTSTGS